MPGCVVAVGRRPGVRSPSAMESLGIKRSTAPCSDRGRDVNVECEGKVRARGDRDSAPRGCGPASAGPLYSDMPARIERCRVSKSRNLISVLNLGDQALTGLFPLPTDPPVPAGPLELLWCPDSGLLQLAHAFDPLLL